MSKIKVYRANLPKVYLLSSLRWMLLIMPIVVLFYQENGLSMIQIMLLQSIFSVAIILFEIPSGYFSDVIGRKTTLVIGCVLGFLGFCIYSISYNFQGFLAAEIIMGLGSSFISGTDSALIYDSLVEMGEAERYVRFEGKKIAICNFSEGVASIAGGFLATISLRTPFYFETAMNFFTILVALTLTEPDRHKFDISEGKIKGILSIVKFSMHDHREVKWLIIYSSLVGASTLTMVWLIQPYLKIAGLPIRFFGIVWAALNFAVGIFSFNAHKFEALLGRKRTLISLIFLTAVGYFLVAAFQKLWAIGFLLIFYFVRGINSPVLKDYLNRLITSDKRATVLSVQGMIGRLIFALVGPFIGWVTDIYSLSCALAISGTTFFVFGLVALVFLRLHHGL